MKQVCLQTIEELERQGAIVERIDLPIVSFGVPVYYILTSAEVSTNMAKFDGLRFGLQDETVDKDSIYAYYASIRSEGFGEEVKRRILIGSYVLSA
ncbi:MAG: amidase family protein [bacterium]|nr:amidase family protein [bacterium]